MLPSVFPRCSARRDPRGDAVHKTFLQEFNTMTSTTVADVMTRTLVTITPDCTIPQLEKVLTDHEIGAVPVLDRG